MFKPFALAFVALMALCGAAGVLVSVTCIVEGLSSNTPKLLVPAAGSLVFGVGAFITATLCARMVRDPSCVP